jgi:nitrogen-specific signal transduction histidine kinase
MDIKKLIARSKRDFDISISMIGVIPLLVFTYLIIAKLATVKILIGQIGYIIFCTILVFLVGVFVGKRMFSSLVNEIMEKNKSAAITETALGVGDQINNPLLAIRGNLEIVEMYALENKLPPKVIDRIKTIKDNFERIRQITDKMSNLGKPKTTSIIGKSSMVDFLNSK